METDELAPRFWELGVRVSVNKLFDSLVDFEGDILEHCVANKFGLMAKRCPKCRHTAKLMTSTKLQCITLEVPFFWTSMSVSNASWTVKTCLRTDCSVGGIVSNFFEIR